MRAGSRTRWGAARKNKVSCSERREVKAGSDKAEACSVYRQAGGAKFIGTNTNQQPRSTNQITICGGSGRLEARGCKLEVDIRQREGGKREAGGAAASTASKQ